MRCSLLRVAVFAALFCQLLAPPASAASPAQLKIATFQSDITPPLGQPMFCGDPLRVVEKPLLAKGVILESDGNRYVLCALDWCLLCNGSYQEFRRAIAAAAGTEPSRVALQTVHQHTAPIIDMDAYAILAKYNAEKEHVDPKALEDIENRLATAVKSAVDKLEPFDSIGASQAKVERVAANRRIINNQGKCNASRASSCKDKKLQALPEGRIDPYLKTITFAKGEKPLARIHYYATHPQSKYGDNRATSDFAGIARERLQEKEGVFQIYFNGCGADIAAGKYNDGSETDRKGLADRLFAGMEASAAAVKYVPAAPIQWKVVPVIYPRRSDPGFTIDDCIARLKELTSDIKSQKDVKFASVMKFYRSAMRAASLNRADQPIDLTSLRIGDVYIVHLPSEPMIEFQLFAQKIKPNAFVAVAGYGDDALGYLCTKKAFDEGGYEPTVSIAKPEAEDLTKTAIASLLGVQAD